MHSHSTLYLLLAVAYSEAAFHYLRHHAYGDAMREISIAFLHMGLAYSVLTNMGMISPLTT